MQDLATMPTRAIEPMKPPAPAISFAATTPLPRASASMMKKPDEAGAGAAGVAAAPPKGGPSAKPGAKPGPKGKSKAPFYALAAVAVVGLGLGAYVVFLRAPAQRQQQAVIDTAKARADREAVARASAKGTLALSGNIPSNARITVDSQPVARRDSLAPGRHILRIEASGYRPYEKPVDIAPNGVLELPIQLQSMTNQQDPLPIAPTANCSSIQVGMRNVNNVCYDVRPRPLSTAIVEAPASCGSDLRPASVTLQVSATGDVLTSLLGGASSGCAAFDQLAVAQVQDMKFQPATKGNRPVAAWINQPVRPTPR
jgi:hypothetical protein